MIPTRYVLLIFVFSSEYRLTSHSRETLSSPAAGFSQRNGDCTVFVSGERVKGWSTLYARQYPGFVVFRTSPRHLGFLIVAEFLRCRVQVQCWFSPCRNITGVVQYRSMDKNRISLLLDQLHTSISRGARWLHVPSPLSGARIRPSLSRIG